MKEALSKLLQQSLSQLQQNTVLPADCKINIQLSVCKDPKHGDYATNCALILAKTLAKPPRSIAEAIVQALPESNFVAKVDIAGPGFINFFLSESCFYNVISQAIEAKTRFGCSQIGQGKRIHMEYVSANPTGPLHVGHGRGAAFGATVANLLKACSYDVHREYYVNDAGRQMQILALSVWIRYLQIHEEQVELPKKAYQGDYVTDIARKLSIRYQSQFHHTQQSLADCQQIEDEEEQLDKLVEAAKTVLGKAAFEVIFQFSMKEILDDICDDLAEFGVEYDSWFHESRLFTEDLVKASLELLEKHGYVFEKDGAKWFKATAFGDEKDRVLVRANGVSTYFASDVAYHLYKYRENYDAIIDVFGADHHGYIARIRGFLNALGEDPLKVTILMVQFAILYRGKERVSMSTRGGEFVTLRELREEVGNDAARFFYIMRKPDQHLDFDLKLATSQSSDNPVYYIQYAHARICSVWRQLEASEQSWDQQMGFNYLSLLTTDHEKSLTRFLLHYPELIENCAINHEPHTLAHKLQELANTFHAYYNSEKFLVEQSPLRNARLCLIAAVQQVFVNGLALLGISAPEVM